MAQYVSDPPEEKEINREPGPGARVAPLPPARLAHSRYSRAGFVTLFVLISLALLVFSGQIVLSFAQTSSASAAQQAAATPQASSRASATAAAPTSTGTSLPTPTATVSVPFFAPNNTQLSSLQLSTGHYVLYQDTTRMYLVSTTDNSVQWLYTPDYAYNQAIRPLLTPDNHLLYTGSKGIWMVGLFDQQAVQLATLTPDLAVTSLALSQDGKAVAWTVEPVDGTGQISLYAGPLTSPQLIRQQSALDCPCLRIFSFLNGNTNAADTTLLLTDDRGSNLAVQYGLWALDLSRPAAEPQLLMDETSQQGPLVFQPYSTTLLYAPYEGAVPVPTDGSVPADIAALSYANSLSLETLDSATLEPGAPQVVLREQKNVPSSQQATWITTPTFSPDGQTLAYIEFSSDPQAPYDRHSALWTVHVSGSGEQIQVGRPQLAALSTARMVELGPWLNSHTIILYGDGSLYALDTQSNALTTLVQSNHYLRILGILGIGQT